MDKGVPIGNYLSQFFANLYLAYLDRAIVNKFNIRYYRYADDIVILSKDKATLHEVLQFLIEELDELKLTLKDNYQIFPVESRGIDFVGYVFYHKYILLRKSIKVNFCRKIRKLNKSDISYEVYRQQICSYLGWLKYCNSYNLLYKYIKYKELISIANNK